MKVIEDTQLIPRRFIPRGGVSSLEELRRYDLRPRRNRRCRTGYQFYPVVFYYPDRKKYVVHNGAGWPRAIGGLA